MGIFDILGNPAVCEIIGSLAGQMQNAPRSGAASAAAGSGLQDILGQLAGQLQGNARAASGSGANAGALGGLGGGLLSAVLGQMMASGRSGGKMSKAAGLAGVAAVALNFYQKWAQMQAAQKGSQAQGLGDFGGALDETSVLLLKAMIFAAGADGHIDQEELTRIRSVVQEMCPGQNVEPLVHELTKDGIDPETLARQVRSADQAEDLYRFSCLIVNVDTVAEQQYLDRLAQALHLDAAAKASLDQETAVAKEQLAGLC